MGDGDLEERLLPVRGVWRQARVAYAIPTLQSRAVPAETAWPFIWIDGFQARTMAQPSELEVMAVYKKILVTLDRSRLSEAVLPELRKLLDGSPAEVTLLTVGRPPQATRRRRGGPSSGSSKAARSSFASWALMRPCSTNSRMRRRPSRPPRMPTPVRLTPWSRLTFTCAPPRRARRRTSTSGGGGDEAKSISTLPE